MTTKASTAAVPATPETGAGPKVSVVMITFNHADVIRQSLDSVLGQKTNFPYEVIIGDDCSTDGTREVVREYAARSGGRLRALLHERNLGMLGKRNLVSVFAEARGEYVAVLEGDDFWTRDDKLQRQAEALDRHPECSGSFTNTRLVVGREAVGDAVVFPADQPPMTDLGRMIEHHFPHTSSVMVRRRHVPEFPDWYFEMPMGDWPLFVLTARHGPYAYLPEVMSAYRRHAGGAWTTKTLVERTGGEIRAFETFDRVLEGRYHGVIAPHLNLRQLWMAEGFDELGDRVRARQHFRIHLRGPQRHPASTLRKRVRLGLKLYCPWVFSALKGARDAVARPPAGG